MNRFIILSLTFLIFSCSTSEKTKPIVQHNNNEIAYSDCGKGDTTLLFVHGWCINKEYWEPQLKYFCPKYKVVAIDLPGFGKSGNINANWNFDDYTEDVKAVIEQLQLKNVILIGHSMSGDMLLKFGNKYPSLIKGIVGIDNLHEPAGPMDEAAKLGTDQFFKLMFEKFDSIVSATMNVYLFQPSTSSSVVARVTNDILSTDSSIAVKVLQSLSDVAQNEQKLMQGLKHKLYLLNSDVMPVKADSLSKYCAKGFHLETVHGTGHYPMIEKPDEFNAALQKIINQINKD